MNEDNKDTQTNLWIPSFLPVFIRRARSVQFGA